jgi:hypothetical protein
MERGAGCSLSLPPVWGERGHASRPDVRQVDTTRLMMVLVDDRDSGVGDLHASYLRGLTFGWEHGADGAAHSLSANSDEIQSATFPQPESGIVTLSPVVQRTDVAERHYSGRSAVSLLGD